LILSGIGSQFTTVAMAWQIYELTNSPLQIGLLGLARGIPQIIVLLVGGLLADAMDRRKPMMWTQTSLFSGSRCAKDGAHPPPDPLRPLEFGKP
jgi:MFS family permease